MSASPGTSAGLDLAALADRARVAARALATASRGAKDAALLRAADALAADTPLVLSANAEDLTRAAAAGMTPALLDRLTLTPARVGAMAEALRVVAGLPDPVGDVVRGATLANGIELRQLRVPFGVVAVIYEGRPNVTVDAAGLCLKAGNAVLLRGSSSAAASNAALVEVLRAALAPDLPLGAIQLVPATDHASVTDLVRLRGRVDLAIPRGGAGLIRAVVDQATVPVIETGVGVCHVYVDAAADPDQAVAVVLDAKTSRPGTCNTAETLLVHAAHTGGLLPRLLRALADAGVTLHGDDRAQAAESRVRPVAEADWDTEWLSLDLSVRVVDSLDEAVTHVGAHSTGHTEAVLTRDLAAARRFVAEVDAAAVVVNASTRFTDGGQMGFGAEIGISTQKLHARGPMGLPELTTTKYVLSGDGHVRG